MDISSVFRHNSSVLPRVVLALVIAAGIACAAAPAAEQLHAIAPGVTLAGNDLGGLTALPARDRIEAIVSRPVTIWYRGTSVTVSAERLGVQAAVDRAVESALDAGPQGRVGIRASYSAAAVDALVASLRHRFDRPALPARVVGAGAHGPLILPEHVGLAVQGNALAAAVEHQLATGTRDPLVLPVAAVLPARPAPTSIIVVDRSTNTLRLYRGTKLVHTFPVATGQSIYPTPSGIFSIVVKERDPWWYPPTYDSWAKGLKPVPPGPSNPLGTRWMGLSVPGVGIHGTDAPSSIGYSASHGCIRMQVPDAEWLFEHVTVGTPVVIL